MATHRYTLLLEDKLTRAYHELSRLSPNDLRDEATMTALYEKYQVTPPQLSFDPNRKAYLDGGRCRLAIGVIQGDMYPLEELLEEKYLNRALIPHTIAIRPGSREIWVEYGGGNVPMAEVHQFPRQIFDHLNRMVAQGIAPDIQQVNLLLRQKMNAFIRERRG